MPEGIYLHVARIQTLTNMPQQTQHPSRSTSSHVQKIPLFFPRFTSIILFSFVSLSKLLVARSSHKVFFFHLRQCASPPSSLPGIPESILAIENVKNEEKAEEGTMSTAAGRVLSRCTDIPQSPGVAVAQNGWDLT